MERVKRTRTGSRQRRALSHLKKLWPCFVVKEECTGFYTAVEECYGTWIPKPQGPGGSSGEFTKNTNAWVTPQTFTLESLRMEP